MRASIQFLSVALPLALAAEELGFAQRITSFADPFEKLLAERETCKKVPFPTCETSCGPGNLSCVYDDYCFNPSAGETCCSSGSGSPPSYLNRESQRASSSVTNILSPQNRILSRRLLLHHGRLLSHRADMPGQRHRHRARLHRHLPEHDLDLAHHDFANDDFHVDSNYNHVDSNYDHFDDVQHDHHHPDNDFVFVDHDFRCGRRCGQRLYRVGGDHHAETGGDDGGCWREWGRCAREECGAWIGSADDVGALDFQDRSEGMRRLLKFRFG
jgi:hypothetical protein